jgi:hypothetical protein
MLSMRLGRSLENPAVPEGTADDSKPGIALDAMAGIGLRSGRGIA